MKCYTMQSKNRATLGITPALAGAAISEAQCEWGSRNGSVTLIGSTEYSPQTEVGNKTYENTKDD